MKYTEIKELTDKELVDKMAEEKQALVKLKINHTVSPLENPMKIRVARKKIARFQTELVVRKNKK